MWLAMKASLQEKCYWILKDSSPLQKYSCPMKFIYSYLYYLCYWSKTLHIRLCTTASLSHLTMWHDKYQSWTNHRKNCSQWDRHTKVLNSQVPGTNKITKYASSCIQGKLNFSSTRFDIECVLYFTTFLLNICSTQMISKVIIIR